MSFGKYKKEVQNEDVHFGTFVVEVLSFLYIPVKNGDGVFAICLKECGGLTHIPIGELQKISVTNDA